MAARFCLLILLALGIALIGLPQSAEHLRLENPWPLLGLWLATLKLVAIPFSLLLLGFTKSGIVKVLHLVWGLWLTGITLALLFAKNPLSPHLTPYGLVAIIAVLAFSLGLAMLSVMSIFPPAKRAPGVH